MVPYGMDHGSIKVGDLMTNAKLPRSARANWPLVLAGEVVAWVPGIRRSNHHLVGAESENIIKLVFERKQVDGI